LFSEHALAQHTGRFVIGYLRRFPKNKNNTPPRNDITKNQAKSNQAYSKIEEWIILKMRSDREFSVSVEAN
jgi:hypothetical protein